jgi:hypothetical protein
MHELFWLIASAVLSGYLIEVPETLQKASNAAELGSAALAPEKSTLVLSGLLSAFEGRKESAAPKEGVAVENARGEEPCDAAQDVLPAP